VNADRTLEWEEFLNYIVESGYSGGGGGGSEGAGTAGTSDASSYFASRFAYRALSGPEGGAAGGGGNGGGGGGPTGSSMATADPANIFDVFTHATWCTDPDTEEVFLLGYRKGGMMVQALHFGQEMQLPVLLPLRKFRHDFAFQSHMVLQACYVGEVGQVVTCSSEFEGGPSHLNFFSWATGAALRRIRIDGPLTGLVYAPAMQLVYGMCDEMGTVIAVDVPTATVSASFSQGDSLIMQSVPVPGNLSGALFVGTSEGALAVWDLRAGKQVPGMRVLAHDFGVASLVFSESRSLMISVGGPHPRRLQGLPPTVYAVLIWDVADWVAECREGDVYSRVTGKAVAGSIGAGGRSLGATASATTRGGETLPTTPTAGRRAGLSPGGGPSGGRRAGGAGRRGGGGDASSSSSSSSAHLAASIAAASRAMRPRVLTGHRFPVTAVAVQDEPGTLAHIVSADEGGQLRVWDLAKGDCLQILPLFPAPRLASLNRGAVELGKAGLDDLAVDGGPSQGGSSPTRSGRTGGGDDDDGFASDGGKRSPSPAGRLTDAQKASVVDFLSKLSGGASAVAAASTSGLLPPPITMPTMSSSGAARAGRRRSSVGAPLVPSGSAGGGGGAEEAQKAFRAGRRMSYSRASVMLYPDKGEGQAEADVKALVSAGQLDADLGGANAIVEGILRTGNKYGVGVARPTGIFGPQGSVADGDDGMGGGGGGWGSGGGGALGRLMGGKGNVANPPSVLSTALSLVGLPGLVKELSPRRMKLMGDRSGAVGSGGGGAHHGGGFLPMSSQDKQLAASASSAAHTFKREQQRAAESALREAGIAVASLPPSARKMLLDPISSKKGSAGGPESSMSGSADGPSPVRRAGNGGGGGRRGSAGNGPQLLGPDGNVLSAMLDLRLQGRRGSISDLAMMLQREASSQAGEDSEARRKQMSEAAGGAKITAGEHHHDGGDGAGGGGGMGGGGDGMPGPRIPDGAPTLILLFPKSVGGHEKRNLMLVGGDRVGITAAMATAGGLATRHGMRLMTWMQDLPDREPLLTSQFIAPSLNFMTATASAVVVWDALSGRPLRVYDNRICDGKEITCATLDRRQRKIIVGDITGRQWVINLVSGAVMKQLDPRASKPRKAVLAATEQRRKVALAALLSSSATLSGAGADAAAAAVAAAAAGTSQELSVWTAGPSGGGSAASLIEGGNTMANAPAGSSSSSAAVHANASKGQVAQTGTGAGGSSALATLDARTPRGFTVVTTKSGKHVAVSDNGGLPPYNAPLTLLAFSPRLEVLSTAGDGSVWLCEERSEGWGLGSLTSTIVRVFSLPLELYRTTALVPLPGAGAAFDEPDPIIAAVRGTNGYSYLSAYQAAAQGYSSSGGAGGYGGGDGTVSVWGGGGGVGASASVASSSLSSLPSLPALMMPSIAASSFMQLPSIEGGSSFLSGRDGYPASTPLGLGGGGGSPRAGAADASSSASASAPQPAGPQTPAPPLLDGTLRVTHVTFSVRLNLLATCSRLLRDVPQTETEGGDDEAEDDPNASIAEALDGGDAPNARGGSGLVDDDSYVLLLFDYEKATLVGACARSPTDRKNLPRHVAERYHAANVLASVEAVSITHAAATAALNGDGSSSGGGTPGLLKLDSSSDLLLPASTAMAFLDPLPALATAHEDGAIRIWAVPPAAMPFTLRLIFYVPSNPSMTIYSRSVKKVSAAHAKRQLTNAAKRIVEKIGAGGAEGEGWAAGGGGGAQRGGAGADGNEAGTGAGSGGVTFARRGSVGGGMGRRRSSVGGIDPDDIPALLQRRYAVCMATRPAHLTPPMTFGSLFPTGHSPFMPDGKVAPFAPPPAAQLFHEAAKGPEATGHVDPRKLSTASLKDPNVANGLNGGADGTVFWLGDTDGEIHRFFVSSAAFAAAGLQAVPAVGLEDTVMLERRLEDTALHPAAVSVGLSWSRSQAKAWATKQSRTALAAVAFTRAVAAASAAAAGDGGEPSSPTVLSPPVHPSLLYFYAQAGRHALFPLVGEALPPSALAAAEDPLTGLPAAGSTPSLPPFARTVTFGGLSLAGPLGAVWEGSWRAHQSGDVVSLQALADSGFHGLLSAGQDGLARIWDTCGRLVGSLDPQPRFTAPMPDWERHDPLPELLEKTMARNSAAAAAMAGGAGGKDDDQFSLPSEMSAHGADARPAKGTRGGGSRGAGGVTGADGAAQGNGGGEEEEDEDGENAESHQGSGAAPPEYGPGSGSGYSFDKWSMTHICTDRVYDGRMVYVPAGCEMSKTNNSIGKPKATTAAAAGAAQGGKGGAAAASPSPKGAAASSSSASGDGPVPDELALELPPAWRPGSLAMVGRKAPALFGPRVFLLNFPRDGAVAVMTAVAIESAGVDPAAAARPRPGGRRRSSVGMTSVGPTTMLALPPPTGQRDSFHPAAIAAAAAAASGPKEAGVYFAALAPPQRQVLWHVNWDLVTRRNAQLGFAEQALSLVKLVRLRDMSGWGRRSSLIQSAARRLSQAMISLAATEALQAEAHATAQAAHASAQAAAGEGGAGGSSSTPSRRGGEAQERQQQASPASALKAPPPAVATAFMAASATAGMRLTHEEKSKPSSVPLATAIAKTAVAMAQDAVAAQAAQAAQAAGVAHGGKAGALSSPSATPRAGGGKTVRIAAASPTGAVAAVAASPSSSSAAAAAGTASLRSPTSSSALSPRALALKAAAREPTELEKLLREDPVAATLHDLYNETRKERKSGVDGSGMDARARGLLPMKGAAFETRMRQEAAREAIAKRRQAREREAEAKEAARKGETPDPSTGGSGSEDEGGADQGGALDALSGLVASIAVRGGSAGSGGK
jgi:hypothetical protein